ncbi:MAG: hypothetical protein M1830_007831 [Pleopsidium flavum]|nr:MAG: hypothetical protein M1830_007831 [Pleopsidium flavum]
MTDHDRLEHYTHVEHCLELLRQAAVCKGDTSITAFKWLKTGRHTLEPSTKEGVLHTCVNWDRLAAWAHERAVDLFDPNTLVPPPSGQ